MRSSISKIQIPHLTPILPAHRHRQTRQILAPAASSPPLVEILEQQDKAYQHADEREDAYQPPGPPDPAAVAEEAQGVRDESFQAGVGAGAGLRLDGVGCRGGGAAAGDCAGGAQDADAEDEAHEEAADVAEIV